MRDTIYRRFIENNGLDPEIEAVTYKKGIAILESYYTGIEKIEETLEKGTLRTPNAFYSFHRKHLEEL